MPLVFLLAIALGVRLAVFLSGSAVLWPDSVTYYRIAVDLAREGDLTGYPIYRTPLYPLFLSVFLRNGEGLDVGRAILGSQLIVGAASVAFFYGAFAQWTSRRVAFLAGLLFSVYPLELYYELVIQTEVLFNLFFAITFYFVSCQLKSDEPLRAVLIGAYAGLATLTRPIAQLLPLLILFAILLHTRSFRATLRNAFLIFVPLLMVLAPWLLWNHAQKGYWGLSRELGINLFHRAVDADRLTPPEESLPPPVERILERRGDGPGAVYFSVWHRLRKAGLSELEAENKMLSIGVSTIRQSLGVYLQNSIVVWVRYFLDTRPSPARCRLGNTVVLCSGRPVPPNPTFGMSSVEEVTTGGNAIVSYVGGIRWPMGIVCALAWIGLAYRLVVRRSERVFSVFLVLVILYFSTLTAIFNLEEDRFRLPIDPILFLLALEACSELTKRLFNSRPSKEGPHWTASAG